MAVGSAGADVAWGMAVGAAEEPHATTTAKTTVTKAGNTNLGLDARLKNLLIMFFMVLFASLLFKWLTRREAVEY